MSQPDPVALVIRTLVNQPLCASCIAERTRLSMDDVIEALERMARVRATTEMNERCPVCERPGPVYRIPDATGGPG